MPKSKKSFFTSSNNRWITIGLSLAALIVVASVAFATFHDNINSDTVEKIPVNSSSSSKDLSDKNTDSTQSGDASQPVTNKPATSTGSQASMNGTLLAPYGSFVSNHKPGQNGSDMVELSQCTTSAGATCYIKFTQGGTVKTLPVKTADSNGFISWEWNVNDAGLTRGNWSIEATAKMGDQTKSTTDQLNLEVQ